MAAGWSACLVLCLAVSAYAVTTEHSGPVVVSADQFMRSLHLQHHHPHRSNSDFQAVRPGWKSKPALRGDQPNPLEQGELGEAGPTPIKATPTKDPPKLKRDLDRLRQLSKPSAKEQRRMDLASERKHFPKTEQQITTLKEGLQSSKKQDIAVTKLSQLARKKFKTKQSEMRKVQDQQEYALMTDPHAEQAEMDADSSLAKLHAVTEGYTKKVKAQEAEVGKLGEMLEQRMHQRQANLVAVKLFHKFRTEYEENMTGRVAAMSAEFHKKAMAAAGAHAHTLFEKYKTDFLKKEEVATNQHLKDMKARRLARAKRRAQEHAEMDAKAKLEAKEMYKSYVERFHDMEQQQASMEVESRLGEGDY